MLWLLAQAPEAHGASHPPTHGARHMSTADWTGAGSLMLFLQDCPQLPRTGRQRQECLPAAALAAA